MSACFTGASTANIERFFLNLCAFDANVPHTKTRISPITFCNFLIRNQIQTITPLVVYEEANKIWRKLQETSPGLMEASCPVRAKFDLDKCEVEHKSWNMMIDYLLRMLDVVEFADSPYYQMHYVAHVAYMFNKATEAFDTEKCATYRTIFNDLISPVLYDNLIPTTYSFLPVKDCADMRFNEGLNNMLIKVNNYVYSHAANHMNYLMLDGSRCYQFHQDLKEIMSTIHANKYQGEEAWTNPLRIYFGKIGVYKTDVEMFEMYDSFKRDGIQHVGIIEQLMKVKKRFDSGVYENDPDEAIDDLLEIYGNVINILKAIGPEYEKEKARLEANNKPPKKKKDDHDKA